MIKLIYKTNKTVFDEVFFHGLLFMYFQEIMSKQKEYVISNSPRFLRTKEKIRHDFLNEKEKLCNWCSIANIKS